jgi:O-antigen ligase
MVQYISYAGILFFLIHDKSEQHWKKCLQMYLYGVVLLCAVIITTGIMTAPSNWLSLFAKGEFRFGKTQLEDEELMRLILNANNLGNYSAVGGCVGLMLVEHSKGKQKVMNALLTITALSGGFLSISRSWLLVIAICLFLYILGKVRNPKRLLSAVLVFALLAVVGLLMMGDRTEFLEAFLTRMGGDDLITGNGRWEHFVQYMEAYLSDPRYILFGTGVTQYKAMTGLWGSLHNGTQQILVCCGILGFVVYLAGLIKPIADIRRTGKRKLAYWIPWIGVVLYIQTTQFLNPMMLMMSYAIGVFALKLGEVENETVHRYG